MSFYREKVSDKNNIEYKSKKCRRLKAEHHIQSNHNKELIVKKQSIENEELY